MLKDKIPYVFLCELPTPVEKLNKIGSDLGLDNLYIKRDDLSGLIYGGNKVRKLEFMLGHLLKSNAKSVLTFGSAGSNHALATAIYAQKIGLRCISMLMPQPVAYYVRRNLLMSYYCKAELHLCQNERAIKKETAQLLLRYKQKYGNSPEMIPTGGTSPLGTIGFINAAFELKKQIIEGEMPEPDIIYAGLGSTGTVVGLMIGLKAANLKTKVISVRVADEKYTSTSKIINHFHETNSLLHTADPSFPNYELHEKDIIIRHDFLGEQYGLFTPEGMEAIKRMEQAEGIKLDGCYTGKVFAALINDAEKQNLRNKRVLFWNTLNSRDFSKSIIDIDYRRLPKAFHVYFEEDVQPLDRH